MPQAQPQQQAPQQAPQPQQAPSQKPAIDPGGKHPMRHMAMIGISILVTATVVGGGIYVWLNMQSQQAAADARDQISTLEEEKTDLEEQVMELKSDAEAMEEEAMQEPELPDVTFVVASEDGMIVKVFDHGSEVGEIEMPLGFWGEPYIFEQIGDQVFFSVPPDGLGGYILYSGALTLFQYDSTDRSITQIDLRSGFATDVSPDGQFVAISSPAAGEGEESEYARDILVVELATDEEVSFPADTSYGQVGTIKFSPNGKLIAYAGSVADPISDESGGVHVINLTTGEDTLIAEGDFPPAVTGWADNETPTYEF